MEKKQMETTEKDKQDDGKEKKGKKETLGWIEWKSDKSETKKRDVDEEKKREIRKVMLRFFWIMCDL